MKIEISIPSSKKETKAQNKFESDKIPFRVRFLSSFSLIISFVLIALLLLASYLIWNVIFYILISILVVGFLYRSFLKERGLVLNRLKDSEIFQIADSAAKLVGTKVPDKIILVKDSSIGVTGVFERTLLIGISTMHFLTKKELYSILFHEFAHFKGLDNIIGSSLMKTTVTLRDMVTGSSYTHWIIYLPLLIFYYLYALTTLLYSRQREFWADWIASTFVGGEVFGRSLDRYVKIVVDFNSKIGHIIKHYASQNLLLKNIYDAYRKLNFSEEFEREMSKQKKKAYESSSMFSTHPATKVRIERVKSVRGSVRNFPDGKCSDLFNNLEEKEEELTNLVYSKLIKRK